MAHRCGLSGPMRNIDVPVRSGEPAMKATEHVPVRVPQAGRQERALAVRMSVLFASGIVILSGCASGPFRPVIKTSAARVADQLVPFASCGDALRNLQAAASNAVAGFAAASRSAGAAGG